MRTDSLNTQWLGTQKRTGRNKACWNDIIVNSTCKPISHNLGTLKIYSDASVVLLNLFQIHIWTLKSLRTAHNFTIRNNAKSNNWFWPEQVSQWFLYCVFHSFLLSLTAGTIKFVWGHGWDILWDETHTKAQWLVF